MAAKAELDLREILLTTGLVQPVKVEGRAGRLTALCREVPGQTQAWLKVVETVLRESAGTEMSFHLCRQYVWKDGRMVFGWHVGLEAKNGSDLNLHLTWLREQLRNVEPELTAEPPPAAPAAAPVVPQASQAPQGDEELLDDEEEPQGPPSAELVARRAEFRKHTNATPRMPDPVPAGVQVPPEAKVKPTLRVIERGTAKDQKNRIVPVTVEEFPLPGVYTSDMNKPNEKGRGASTLG